MWKRLQSLFGKNPSKLDFFKAAGKTDSPRSHLLDNFDATKAGASEVDVLPKKK